MKWWVVSCAAILAGCAPQQVTAAKPCIVETQTFNNDGSETQLQMLVAKDAEKCAIFVARIVADPETTTTKGEIITPASHGTANGFTERTGLVVRGVAAAVGFGTGAATQQIAVGAVYRPHKGYVGDDEFGFVVRSVRRGVFRVKVRVAAI